MFINSYQFTFKINVFLLSIFSICFISFQGVCSTEKDISELWSIQHRALQGSRYSTSEYESAKATIYDFMLDSGVRRSVFIAAAYSAEGASLVKKDNIQGAVWCFKSALDFDPAYMPAARGLIAASFSENPISFVFAIPILSKTIFFSLTEIWNAYSFFGNLAIYIRFWLFLTLSVYVLTMVLLKSPLMVNDISERFIKHISDKIGWPILVFLIALPLILGRGFLWTLLWVIFLVFFYMNKRESIILGVLFGLTFLVLPANIIKTMVFKGYDNALLQAYAFSESGSYSSRLTTWLKEEYKNENNPRAHFMLGLFYKRGGHYFESLREYLEYTRLNKHDSRGHINLGNVYFILNNLSEAISEYRRAENLNRESAAVYYNLSKAYLHQFKFDQATDMIRKASNIDADLVNHYTEIHSTVPNRMLVDESYPLSWLIDEIKKLWSESLADQKDYWVKLGPGFNFQGFAMIFGGMALVLMLVSFLKARLNLSRYCLMCDRATLASKSSESGSRKYCEQCEVLFIKKGKTDLSKRDTIMREVSKRTRIKHIASTIMSVLFPGTGDLVRGRTIRGTLLITLWSLLLSFLLKSDPHFIPFHYVQTVGDSLNLILLIVILVVTYSMSLLLSLRGDYK